ncbi:hypothetical protein GCM10023195_60550 [Actinoallomurus liliacearum]|uniref:Uncharacterized protein n=1 Tax=Actinoallomurus liliacearum TaxID=1080073 RepID=A0ABP8TVI7_9ACTN
MSATRGVTGAPCGPGTAATSTSGRLPDAHGQAGSGAFQNPGYANHRLREPGTTPSNWSNAVSPMEIRTARSNTSLR